MRKGLPWVLAVCLSSAAQLLAQPAGTGSPQTGPPLDSKDAAAVSPGAAIINSSSMVDGAASYRVWARAEYLLWWVKDAPLPVPIVTTGDARVGFDPNLVNTVNTAGAIGQPGTQVLLGESTIRLPAFSGTRLTLGGWLDDDQRLGAVANSFVLQRRSDTFTAGSDKAGNPPLYFPIFSEVAGAERAIPIADPLRSFNGDVAVTSTVQLWGAEVDARYTFFRAAGLEFTLLAGFRYADLRESLHINNTTTDLLFNNVTVLNDSFATSNQFYGGQIGSKLGLQYERFTLDVTGKIALGSTRQAVDIQGDITQLGPNPLVPPGLGTFPGGLFAQPSNMGRRNTDQFTVPFTVLPSLELKLAYEITGRIRAFAGYDLMYWNRVVRPGSQINHNVNLSQNAVLDPNGVGTLVGPAQPAPLFIRSDFWAQGISLGLEFRY